MKWYKKVLAGFLAVLMMVSGVYFVQSEGGSKVVQAAETEDVSTDMLEVKAQIATDGSNVIRFVSSVDGLDYVRVGFEVTPAGGTKKTYETKTVYERIVAAPDATSVKYEFGPKAVSADAEYFVTAKLRATAGVDYTVRAFVKTQDGQTVYGQSRCIAVSDGATNATTVNMSFENTATAAVKVGDTLNVAYGTNGETTASVIGVDGTTVHVRVNVAVGTLKSATKFVFSGSATGSTIYRNLHTTHVPTSGTAANADTTWYDVYLAEDANETEFVIATTADLYGFASLVTAGKSFEGKSAYLCADLKVNTNTPSNPHLDSSWTGYTPQYKWTPIGNYDYQFKGEFDGGDHVIQGLYTNITANFAGLFGATSPSSSVHNLQITDSCFITSTTQAGTVSGRGGGNFYQIYSNAKCVSTYSGGIVGLSDKKTVIDECWFDGTATGLRAVGGMIGFVGLSVTEVSINNCLVSGKVIGTKTDGYTNIGGLIGWTDNRAHVVRMSNSLVRGTYESPTGGVGEYVGNVQGASTVLHLQGNFSVKGNYPEKFVGVMTGTYGTNRNCGRKEADTLKGNAAYTNTVLGFAINEEDQNEDNAWIAVDGAYPELKHFSDATPLDLTAILKADTRWYNWAATDADGNAAGSKVNPYIIKDADDLYGLATIVNEATDNFADKYVVVANDITMNTNTPDNANKVESWASYTPQVEWSTIGTNYNDGTGKDWFSGTFDGQGHTIRGLYTAETNNERWAGLFGVTAATCNIKNFKLEDSYFEANAQVASIVSRGSGTLENIESSAVVVASAFTGETTGDKFVGTNAGGIFGQVHQGSVSLKNCSFSGTVKSAGSVVGGVLGLVSGSMTIEDCSFSGIASSGSGYGAGIVGQISSVTAGKITGCTSTGTISAVGEYVGGIAAYINNSDVDVEECVFTGTATANNRRAGGIIGFVQTSTVDIATCVTTGNVSTVQRCGGIIGEAVGVDNGTATAITMTDCLSAGTTTTTNAGHQQHGGLIGYLLTNATAEATRCVMIGKMVFPSAYPDAARPIVGKVQGTAKYGGAGGVYLINDVDYYPEDLGFIRPISLASGNTGWIGSDGVGHSRKTEAQLTGAAAVTNLPLLQISTDSAGTSTWVATKTGFPTLRIFADPADIYTE